MIHGKKIFWLLVFLMPIWAMAQQEGTLIKGTIIADSALVAGVHVLNLMTEKSAYSDSKGVFSIEANEDDLLIFTSTLLDYWRQSVTAENYKTRSVTVKMTPKVTQLEEVVVNNYSHINAKDLGIINYTPKKITQAERRLKAASGLDLSASAGTMAGVSMSLDPLFNWMSGRTTMLKKEVQVERKEKLLEYLNTQLSDAFYENYLKIPKDKIESFKYYAVEDNQLRSVISQKNFMQTCFKLSDLSVEFNQLQIVPDGE